MDNNKNSKEKNINLIKKLCSRFHSAKISQKILSLVLAGATALTISSCTPLPTPDPNDDITNNENNNQNNNQNNENNNNNQNNENNQNNNQNNNEQNNQQNQIDWSKHSQLLEDLCKNKEYDILIAQAKQIPNFVNSNIGYFEPHPYAFLEDEGFDVEAIKKDEIEAYTFSYVLDDEPNNLYMNTRVLQDNSYWVSYLLKYELTDEEMDDYHMLHKGNSADYFIQSVFMHNEIAKTRDPIYVDKTMISVELYDRLVRNLSEMKVVDTYTCKFVLSNFNGNDRSYDLVVLPVLTEKRTAFTEEKAYKGRFSSGIADMKNWVLIDLNVSVGPVAEINSNKVKATTYLIQDAPLGVAYCKDFEDKR